MSNYNKSKINKTINKMNQVEQSLRSNPNEITEQNLKNLEQSKFTKPIKDSKFVETTNISLVSTNSSYQNNLLNDEYNDEDDQEQINSNLIIDDNSSIDQQTNTSLFMNDPFLRPLSQNSTTSCLSTTATKDGIEGRRLYRNNHLNQYTTNLINNNNQQQYLHQPISKSQLSQQQLEDNDSILDYNNQEKSNEVIPDENKSYDSNNASIISLHQTSIYPNSINSNSNSIQIDD
ncbi:hypothetical protein KGF54_001214 [Candida jiufengensis]|uniref:uncharacterized protein n=1 Tax=Candida jiufengensis TaxID=497108 RepID=UPI0022241981|nr:uncharacterized protein KGF54_001214 [Candida jiufengensis]KAI5955712.1 hypothetical protein KGF54_001214 [Candida jiufengensis]